jgi:hypothetical protein
MERHQPLLAAANQRYGPGMARYTHCRCPICRKGQDFKLLPHERDISGRTLMVCTQCSTKLAVPGQHKPTWKELMEVNDDE